MKKKTMMAFMGMGFMALGASTGANCQKDATVVSEAEQLINCVLTHEVTDPDPTFEGIALECGGIAVATVVSIIGAATTSADGGVAAKRVHHRAAK